MNTIGGNVIVRNGIDLGYCFTECILSLLPVCDVVNVCDSDSSDGTTQVLQDLARQHPKIRVLNYPWKNPSGDVDSLLDWMNWSRERLDTHYHLFLEADELLGPESYDFIRSKAQESEKAVLGFWRYNFWIDENHTLASGHILSPQVIRFAPTAYFMGGDAPHKKATQTEPAAQWSAIHHCKIYHYGFLRKPAHYLKKYNAVMQAINGTDRDDPAFRSLLARAVADGQDWMSLIKLPHEEFAGSHPPIIHQWLKQRSLAA